MKKIRIIILTILTIFITDIAYSVDPTYTLYLTNPVNINANTIEFDIYLKHTNPAQTNFYYSMGQYVLYIASISPQGGNLTYTFSPLPNVSDLPMELRPLNPTVYIGTNNIQLRLAPNVPPASYPGQANPVFSISSTGNGTKIARMRLQSTLRLFSRHNYDIYWKNIGEYNTKIVCNNFSATQSLVKNITNPNNHIGNAFQGNNNHIFGKVFRDYNSNGVQDLGEPNYTSSYTVVVKNAANVNMNGANGNTNGYYCYHLPATGNFTISIAGLPNSPLYIVSPAIQTAEFGGLGYIDDFNDFALTTTQNVNDVKVSMTGFTQRPGFTVTKYLIYQDAGTTSIANIIEMFHDSRLTYLGSDIPSTYYSTIKKITWNYSLNPGESKIIKMNFSSPANIPLGTNLSSTATIYPITGDAKPANNVYTYNEKVKGSFDPNDISVDPPGNISEQAVTNEDSLTYTIRFQNTGTDTAFTVRILDTLSPNMNKESIEVLSSSHAYSYEINENGIAEFTFNYILLPDSTTNEPESHGFIQYRIKPKNTLVTGDSIKNTAYIYFDYNDPVVTNTVNTVVGIRRNYLDLSWHLEAMYPNLDSVSVYLRNSISPYDVYDSANAFASITGSYFNSIMEFNNMENGSAYYLVVKHRNSIETWSANPVAFFTDTTEYNFTTSPAQAYGSNITDLNGIASIYSGDVNQDGVVDLADVSLIDNDAFNFAGGYIATDLNGDGLADISDLLVADNNAFNFVSVMRP